MIKLNNKWIITSDGNCYTLLIDTDRTDKHGKKVLTTIGYYGTLKDALNGYARHKVLDTVKDTDMTLKDVQGLLNEVKSDIEKVVA